MIARLGLVAGLVLSVTASSALAADAGPGGHDIRVQVTARNAATIGAGMAGRLVQFPFRDGDRFKEGQVLAKFFCAAQEGNLARARAIAEKKKHILETNEKLHNLGTNSVLEYEVATAEVAEAAGDVATAAALVSNCTIVAPFSGRVASASAREHQFVNEGAPLLEILNDRDLEVEMILPSRWLAWLKQGAIFEVAVDETGKSYKAELARLSGKVDAVSQSIKAYGRITGADGDLLPGMSGRAIITQPDGTRAP